MKITKIVDMTHEVEIFLSAEDINIILNDDKGSLRQILLNINDMTTYLKGVPDHKITEMTGFQRDTLSQFLKEQSSRFARFKGTSFNEKKHIKLGEA